MIDAAGREILEIVADLINEGERATKSNIQKHIHGFRGDSQYLQVRLRKLVQAGYLDRNSLGYTIKEMPPLAIEEITRVDPHELTYVAEESNMIFLICGFIQERQDEVPLLRKEVLRIVSYEEVKFKFMQLAVLFNLLENPNLVPRINLPTRKETDWEEVATEIKGLFNV